MGTRGNSFQSSTPQKQQQQQRPKGIMGKLIWILLLGFCLLVSAKPGTEKEAEEADDDAGEEAEGSAEEAEDAGDTEEEEEEKEFVCNLKYKRIGCYADKGKKDKPLVSFMESDGDLPKFACKCANDAINGGNAIFGLQNLAECWSGPDDSKYDKDGPSEDCVTFDMAKCND